MNLSSILVFTSPENVEVLQNSLSVLPGIEVHHQCHDTGRLIVIQEALDDKTEMEGLRRIKALPKVMAAEMFYHYVDDDAAQDVQHNDDGGTLSWA
jgi:nitrate reductase NapD